MSEPPQDSSLAESAHSNDAELHESGDAPQNEQLVVASEVSVFQGPLPPPSVLKEYQSVNPEVVKFILQMAEKSQGYIQSKDDKELEHNASIHQRRDAIITRGQIFSFAISLVSLLLGAFLAYEGKNIWGGVCFSICVGNLSLVGLGKFLRRDKDKPSPKRQNDDSR